MATFWVVVFLFYIVLHLWGFTTVHGHTNVVNFGACWCAVSVLEHYTFMASVPTRKHSSISTVAKLRGLGCDGRALPAPQGACGLAGTPPRIYTL